jgi:YHS domain-containing protein
MRAKCRICGEALDTKTAHLVVINGKKAYYCSSEEYEIDEAKKKKTTEDKEKVYRLICDIIGRKEIVNSALWKEKVVWNKVAADEVIGQYLEENKDYLTSMIGRLDDVEYNRIRYLSAILKNKLGDYKPKVAVKETEKPKVKVDESFYESAPSTHHRRRALSDLEDEF